MFRCSSVFIVFVHYALPAAVLILRLHVFAEGNAHTISEESTFCSFIDQTNWKCCGFFVHPVSTSAPLRPQFFRKHVSNFLLFFRQIHFVIIFHHFSSKFGPSPTEPFNSGALARDGDGARAPRRRPRVAVRGAFMVHVISPVAESMKSIRCLQGSSMAICAHFSKV